MLETMQPGRAQRGLVDARGVPEPGGSDVQDQRRRRVREPREDVPDYIRPEDGREPVDPDRPRNPPDHRQHGGAEPEERRSDHHEQQVLQHMNLQQERGEWLDG